MLPDSLLSILIDVTGFVAACLICYHLFRRRRSPSETMKSHTHDNFSSFSVQPEPILKKSVEVPSTPAPQEEAVKSQKKFQEVVDKPKKPKKPRVAKDLLPYVPMAMIEDINMPKTKPVRRPRKPKVSPPAPEVVVATVKPKRVPKKK